MVRKLESYIADKVRAEQDDRDLTSRSDLRRDRLKIEHRYYDLADRLCSTSGKRLAKLGLGEFLLELIEGARRIDSPPARDRALRRIRKELRTVDVAAIERQLDELDHPRSNGAKSLESTWGERLVTTGDEGLEAFLVEYPSADRSQLRALLRNVTRAKEAERARAMKKLCQALGQAIAEARAQSESAEAEPPVISAADEERD